MVSAAAIAGAAALALVPAAAKAHAALLDAAPVQAIALTGRYDTGEPMAGAQVIIYAPDDPAQVWGRAVTDEAGRYVFVPDVALAGRWTVQIRQAGHGAVAHIDLAAADDAGAPATATITTQNAAPDWLQRLVMVALVAWGALGTALWVRSTRRGRTPDGEGGSDASA